MSSSVMIGSPNVCHFFCIFSQLLSETFRKCSHTHLSVTMLPFKFNFIYRALFPAKEHLQVLYIKQISSQITACLSVTAAIFQEALTPVVLLSSDGPAFSCCFSEVPVLLQSFIRTLAASVLVLDMYHEDSVLHFSDFFSTF